MPGPDLSAIRATIRKATNVSAIREVLYPQTDGLETSASGTVQATGSGKVIAFDTGYLGDFPKEVRLLSGKLDGALVAQQTPANLHVAPGDTVSIKRPGMPGGNGEGGWRGRTP